MGSFIFPMAFRSFCMLAIFLLVLFFALLVFVQKTYVKYLYSGYDFFLVHSLFHLTFSEVGYYFFFSLIALNLNNNFSSNFQYV